jgi:hypothetical protein
MNVPKLPESSRFFVDVVDCLRTFEGEDLEYGAV